MKSALFEYAIIWHPTESQTETGLKSALVAGPVCILAATEASANLIAATEIPAEYRNQLDQIQIAIRPF